MTDPEGRVTGYDYFTLDLVSVTRAAGTSLAATTTYTYDPKTFGVTSVTDPDGDVTSYTYDAQGNMLTDTNPLGQMTSYSYNRFGEVVSQTTPLHETTAYEYDSHGNLLSVIKPRSFPTKYVHADAAHPGDVTSVTNPDGDVVSYTYDRFGDVASVSVFPSAGVADTTRYRYDTDGERVCQASPDATKAHVSCPAAGTRRAADTTATSYNADGEITSATNPDGRVTRYSYDPDGNLTELTDAAGHITRYSYNADDQRLKVTSPLGTSTSASYDADGEMTRQVDAAGRVTTYAYDALGRVYSVTNPLGLTTAYGYDAAGNRTTITNPSGQVTDYTYNSARELTGISYASGGTPGTSYTYNADGERTEMFDGTGFTTYAYDEQGRLTTISHGPIPRQLTVSVAYTWDQAGLLTRLTYPDGLSVRRGYDNAGRLTSITDWLGHTMHFGYDADGNLTTEIYPNGVTGAAAFDHADQLVTIGYLTKSATLAAFRYTRNNLGLVTADSETGKVQGTQDYAYTGLNQLASDSAGGFRYDQAGDLTAQPSGITQEYNAAGELVARTAGSNRTTYSYDKQGDRTKISPSAHPAIRLRYDQAGRLTGYGTRVSYAYNGDGLRASKTVTGTTTTFTWDQSTPVPRLVAAGTTSYVYGPLGQPIEQITGSSLVYLMADQHGSTRLLTSVSGKVVGTYSYGPYGVTTRHTGTATTALEYAGQFTDSESGFQYLQARYYDPSTGGFITVDPAVALTSAPYGYADADPVNLPTPPACS